MLLNVYRSFINDSLNVQIMFFFFVYPFWNFDERGIRVIAKHINKFWILKMCLFLSLVILEKVILDSISYIDIVTYVWLFTKVIKMGTIMEDHVWIEMISQRQVKHKPNINL